MIKNCLLLALFVELLIGTWCHRRCVCNVIMVLISGRWKQVVLVDVVGTANGCVGSREGGEYQGPGSG